MGKKLIFVIVVMVLMYGCAITPNLFSEFKTISFKTSGGDTINLVVPIHMPNIFDDTVWRVSNMYPLSEALTGVDFDGLNEFLDPSYGLIYDIDKNKFVAIVEVFVSEGRKGYYLYDDDGIPHEITIKDLRKHFYGEEEYH